MKYARRMEDRMIDKKKLAVGFLVSPQAVCSRNGQWKYSSSLDQLAVEACNNGADQIWIWDTSKDDQGHEAVIGRIKEAARAVDEPLIAGGHIRRLEDVKKYLYAGARAVFLDGSLPEHVDLIQEASSRFGSDKIYVCLPEPGLLSRVEEYRQLGASRMVLDFDLEEGQDLNAALAQNGAPGSAAVFSHPVPEEQLAKILSAPWCQEAVLSLPPEQLGSIMEQKQQLKAGKVPVDTFESTVEWKDFKLDSQGLIPVVVQDYKTSQVLMVAYMNEEAFASTLRTGRMTYYSRSRRCQWVKGETSGNFQYVKSLRLDCDNDTLLALVHPMGPACHTGSTSCFFQTLAEKEYRDTNPLKVFENVYNVILDRKAHPKEGSYTNYLFDKGIDKILKKLGEEATEIVIAAKNPNPEEVKYEISDFLYHMMVLMAERNISWEEITEELANR